MITVAFKKGVQVQKWTYSLDWIMHCLLMISESYKGSDWLPVELVVTSINDGNHSKNPLSRHYTNEAIDIRVHNFATKDDVKKFIEVLDVYINQHSDAARKNAFTILHEYEDLPDEHIHVQPRIGTTYP